MGFADDVAKRISAAFRRDKEQANIQLAKGATGELGGGDSSALDLMSGVGYDALTDYLRLDTDLLMRFADYEEMDDFGEIATALDILADDATQPDSVLHRTIWITSADKTLQNNLDDLFNKTLRMDEEIWEIARTLCKYGNEFEELLVNSDGVRGLNYLPPPTVRRLETPKGDLIGFMQDFKGRFDYSASEYQRVLMTKFEAPVHDSTDAPVAAFESWEVVHFRLRGKERRCLRGTAKVSTPSGLREIQSLRPGDLVFAFDGMGLVQTQVVASGQTGVKKVFSIKTRHREVVATSEHPLLVFSKKRGYHWKSVSDVCEDDLLTLPTTAAPPPSQVRLKDPTEFSRIRLTPAGVQVVKDARNGDRYFFEKLGLEFRDTSVFFSGNTSISTADFEKASAAIPALREDLCFVSHKPNRENFVHSPEFVDPAFAWLFGLLLGDGWIDDHGVSVALGIYPDLNDRIEAAFRSYGLHSSPRYEDITYPETGEIVRVLRTFVVHSSDLADILCNLGFITGAKNKRVPAWVYSSSEEVRRAVVEGFIAADGWDVHQHGKDAIRYEIANRDMAYDFKALVDSLGWTSGNVCVRKERLGKVSTHPAMRGKVVNSSESYILHFHMTPFAASGTVRHERVVKKSELSSDPEPVFDIQIDHPSHAFIADGVVVHNSVYGHSALEAARWIWKRLMLLEDAALVYRLQRAPERFAFYVDVGDLPPQEALAFVNRVRQNFRKKRFVDPGTGKLNLKFDALPVAHDTPIPLMDGRTINIEEMSREHAAGVKHFVYSIDRATGKPVPGEVTWVGQTREKAAALKIVFDDGGSATVAPDHPFMLRDCSYVNAEALKPGDSVMPFYRNLGTGRLDGYEHWYDPTTHKYYPTHRIVSDAVNGPLPKGGVVHHVNFRKRDNTPTNLQTMLWEDHMALHKSAGHTGGVAISVKRKEDPALDKRLRAASTRNLTAYNRSPAKRAATSTSNTLRDSGQFIRRYNTSLKHNEDNEIRRAGKTAMWADAQRKESASANMRLKFPPEFVSVVQGAIRSNPKLRAGAAVAAANTPAALTALRAANARKIDQVHRHMLLKLYRSEGADSFASYKNQVLHPTNHKVVSVTPVDPCDHYCMTVKDWHNFALNLRDDKGEVIFGSGVFVKNSQDEDFFVPTRKGVDSTRIDTLGSPQWQAMDDIEYFRDKLFAAIKVPKAYLGQESGVARAVLSSEDVRFARTVLRIQRELKNGLRKIARVHLSALGIDPYSAEYDVNMTVPSAIFELAQMEVRTAKADLAARMRDFVSLQWILSNVFGLSEDEIAVIKKERGGESADDAKNQAAAQDILAPPPPPMDAPPEGGPPEGAPPEEGPYGPPAEARQPNRILKALNSSRDAARRRGIPTRSGFSDRELNEGRNPAAEKRADAKLDAILKADRGLELRLREIGGLLRDINHRGSR